MVYSNGKGEITGDMGYADAIDIVLSLAEGNRMDEHDIANGDSGMRLMAERQGMALRFLHSMSDRFEALDAAFPAPVLNMPWDPIAMAADMKAAPTNAVGALKAVLDMALNTLCEPDDPNSESDRPLSDAKAVDVVSALIAVHGADLDAVLNARAAPGP